MTEIKLKHTYVTRSGDIIKVLQLWPPEQNETIGRMYNKTDDWFGHFTLDWITSEATKETHPEEFL